MFFFALFPIVSDYGQILTMSKEVAYVFGSSWAHFEIYDAGAGSASA